MNLAWRARWATVAYVRDFAAWSNFFHLTTRRSLTADEMTRLLWAWLKQLARERFRYHFDVAWTVERGDLGGRIHAHALVALRAPSDLDVAHARLDWRKVWPDAGMIDAATYMPERGGAAYLTKISDAWGLGVACPRDRSTCRRRCIRDPHSR